MSAFLLTFRVLCLVFLYTDGQPYMYPRHRFKYHPELENTLCPLEDVLTTQVVDSRIDCSLMCTRHSLCRSFMFGNMLKICVLCKGRYPFTQALRSENGYRHYSDQTRNYHLECTVTSDCNENNNICEDLLQICVCTPGYSFHPGTLTCDAGCETYGTTFEIYEQRHMIGHNEEIMTGVSLEFSKNFCINAEFLCRSFETENDSTWFSSSNALTDPDAYEFNYVTGSYFYNRNCA